MTLYRGSLSRVGLCAGGGGYKGYNAQHNCISGIEELTTVAILLRITMISPCELRVRETKSD